MKLTPVFKDYIWGGTKLKTEYNKKTDMDIVAESWELSCHPNGQCMISNGEFAGRTLESVIPQDDFTTVLGKNSKGMTKFPLLIKLIDAQTDLSVQVHPDDDFAEHTGDSGKTEVWIILESIPGSYIYYGFNKQISKKEFENSLENGSVLELLNKIYVKPGEVYFIKPGTIHALGAGIVIAEIQQNSDITYRLYDYDRRDNKGNPRILHLENGIKCTVLKPVKVHDPPDGYISFCKYFNVKRLIINKPITCYAGEDSFHALLVTTGDGYITHQGNRLNFAKGDCLFIPANTGEYEISGNCEVLVTCI